jgi:hypothetical protein
MEKINPAENNSEKQDNEVTETPPDQTITPDEETDDIMPLKVASGIASRGGGNRIASAMTRANKFFGFVDTEDSETVARMEGASELAGSQQAVAKPGRQIILGRGAIAALIVLLFTIPLLIWLAISVFDLNRQVNALQQANVRLQDQNGQNPALITLLTSSKLTTYKFDNVDPVPQAEAYLHVGGARLWALSTRQLNGSIGRDRQMVLYAIKKVQNPGPEDYTVLAIFSPLSFSLNMIDTIPGDFSPQNYARLIITDEPLNQEPKGKPVGLIRFSLDVSKITVLNP